MHIGIILGGGLRNSNGLPIHVLRRIHCAIAQKDCIDLYITSSRYSLNTTQKLSPDGFVRSEASEMARVVQKLAPEASVITENSSSDTIGSALFCRSLIQSLELVPNILTLYTSNFHMQRAATVFSWAFSLEPLVSGALELRYQPVRGATSTAREQRETASLELFIENWSTIQRSSVAWKKLLNDHDNYNSNFSSEFRANQEHLY